MINALDATCDPGTVRTEAEAALVRTQLAWLELGPGDRVLDVGCGRGAVTREIAALIGPDGEAVGLDPREDRLEEARASDTASTCRFISGYPEAMPFESDTFDAACCRFTLKHAADPAGIIQELARVVRPGGGLLISDIDGDCIQHGGADPEFLAELEAALAHLRRGPNGFHPTIGRELWHLIHLADVEQVHIECRPHDVIAGALPDEDHPRWKGRIDRFVAALAASGWPRARCDALRDELHIHLRAVDTCTLTTLVTVVGRVAQA